MTPRSLFNIILKILGIFFIKDILNTIPLIFGTISLFLSPDAMPETIYSLIATGVLLVIDMIFCYFLIFKTEWLIEKLKLDKGFDQETIPLNLHRSKVLSISIIVIGGYLVVNEVPNFCRQLFVYLQEKRMTHGQTNPKIDFTLLAGSKILVGSLLIYEQKPLVNVIERQRKK